jgi:hypothetical protein
MRSGVRPDLACLDQDLLFIVFLVKGSLEDMQPVGLLKLVGGSRGRAEIRVADPPPPQRAPPDHRGRRVALDHFSTELSSAAGEAHLH